MRPPPWVQFSVMRTSTMADTSISALKCKISCNAKFFNKSLKSTFLQTIYQVTFGAFPPLAWVFWSDHPPIEFLMLSLFLCFQSFDQIILLFSRFYRFFLSQWRLLPLMWTLILSLAVLLSSISSLPLLLFFFVFVVILVQCPCYPFFVFAHLLIGHLHLAAISQNPSQLAQS